MVGGWYTVHSKLKVELIAIMTLSQKLSFIKRIYKKYLNTLNILQLYILFYMCFYFKFVFQGSSSLCQSKETWHRDQDSTGQRLAVLSTNNAMVEASGRLQHSSQGNIQCSWWIYINQGCFVCIIDEKIFIQNIIIAS